MKFCRREKFNEQFHENLIKFFFSKISRPLLRINHKRYKFKYVKCLLNIMSIYHSYDDFPLAVHISADPTGTHG